MSLQSSFRKRWLGRHDTPRSPHKEHGPKGKHQGVGQAVHAGKIHEGLSGIFTGKYEGAGFMQNAPRPGFNVSIAGDTQDIGRRFQQLEKVDGVWEGEMEQSYMANLIDIISPSAKNLRMTKKMAARFGGGQVQVKPVWTRLLEQGKHY